ncbi:transcription termination factor 2-like [Cotesia typhae]|uniref:transcription termination factor 2-like n=1 Tax=Cotesia typhae TaxID=2053667 RepID=UPI003D684385
MSFGCKRKFVESVPLEEKRKRVDYNRNYRRVLNNSYLIDSDSDASDGIVFSDDEPDGAIDVDNPGPSMSANQLNGPNNASDADIIHLEVVNEEIVDDLDSDSDNSENDSDEMNEEFNLNNLPRFDSFEDKFDPEIASKTEELLKEIEETEKEIEHYRTIIETCDLNKLQDKGQRQKDMLEFKESELDRLRKEYDDVLSAKDSQTQAPGSRLSMKKLQVLHGTLLSCPSENQREKTPEGIKTQLKPHQEHALAWLLWRERKNPPNGILADDMGLGKTLTMISLIVKTNEDHLDSEDEDPPASISVSVPKVPQVKGKTLVICPASLLQQWKNEIKNHCHENILMAKIYHGTQRTCDRRLLARYDVVITTYNLVAREYSLKSPSQLGVIARIKWQRVILDEAHIIRNPSAKFCQSVCDLVTSHRWALTGTPIHNRYEDFYSIIRFLRLAPFDDPSTFQNTIQNGVAGNERLTTFIKTFMLRRTKEELQNKGTMDRLPDRTIETIVVTLDDDERKAYQNVMALSKNLFAQFLMMRANKGQRLGSMTYGAFSGYDSVGSSRSGGRGRGGSRGRGRGRGRERGKQNTFTANDLQYLADNAGEIKTSGMVWIFVLILRLRQLCCHPSLIHGLIEQNDVNTIGIDGSDDKEEIDLKKISDLKNIGQNSDDINDILVMSNPVFEKARKSSKVRAVMERVKEILALRDKLIIVSQWTSFLSIFRSSLREVPGAKCAVFSGAVNVRDRQTVVEEFNNPESDTNILLLSLTAGGVGLNLTGGNHILFVDIHWNPQLECQAQDRIYRMGQTKNVFVYKFITDDTIEERVKELQEHKLELAASILTPGSYRSGNRLTLEDLCKLFQ